MFPQLVAWANRLAAGSLMRCCLSFEMYVEHITQAYWMLSRLNSLISIWLCLRRRLDTFSKVRIIPMNMHQGLLMTCRNFDHFEEIQTNSSKFGQIQANSVKLKEWWTTLAKSDNFDQFWVIFGQIRADSVDFGRIQLELLKKIRFFKQLIFKKNLIRISY